jgi:hypothetical protein
LSPQTSGGDQDSRGIDRAREVRKCLLMSVFCRIADNTIGLLRFVAMRVCVELMDASPFVGCMPLDAIKLCFGKQAQADGASADTAISQTAGGLPMLVRASNSLIQTGSSRRPLSDPPCEAYD